MLRDIETHTWPRGHRLIFLLSSLRVAGAELQAIQLARYFTERQGAQVEIWALGTPGDLVARLETARLRWRAFDLDPTAPSVEFAEALRDAEADVLLSFDWQANLLGARLWSECNIGFFVWNQRDAGGFGPEGLLREAAADVPLFLSNAAHACDYLTETLGVHPARIDVVGNAVELEAPALSRAEVRASLRLGHRPVGCMVANIHARKDHATLIRAWARVKKSLAPARQPILVLAGRVDDSRQVRELVSELELDEDVRFLGPTRDTSSLLHAADFAVYSSRSEGLPNGVLEAMAAGLPVAGTDIPGIREAVGDAGVHLLAPSGDAEQLASMILLLACDPTLRSLAGEANRRRSRLFSPEVVCETYSRAVLSSALDSLG